MCPWSPRVVALCLLLAGGVGGLATKSTTVAVDVGVKVEVEIEVNRLTLKRICPSSAEREGAHAQTLPQGNRRPNLIC